MTTPVHTAGPRELAAAIDAARALADARHREELSRHRRDHALRRAHDAGASYGELSLALGLPRQTVVAAVRRAGDEIRQLPGRLDSAKRSDLRREKQAGFERHREMVRALLADPERVMQIARANIPRLRDSLTGDLSQGWVNAWEEALNSGPEEVAHLALLDSDYGDSLRQATPLTGVLSREARSRAQGRVRAS